MHTTDQKWTVALLKILVDMHAPDYAFGHVLGWARGAQAAGFSFNPPGGSSRSKQINHLYDLIPGAQQLLPSRVPLTFADGPAGDVIVIDFVLQLLNLLQNPKQYIPKKVRRHTFMILGKGPRQKILEKTLPSLGQDRRQNNIDDP